jgi:uncharacterized protein (TIGR03437 family)
MALNEKRRCVVLHLLLALVVGASLTSAARAQFVQQGGKLVGTGAVNSNGGAMQGYSVALSADGNTAIVGGWRDNGGAGAVWVFTRLGGVWSQQGNKLVGTGAAGNAMQGSSVALSADGNTAIVGGPADNSSAGAAWVYTRSGGVWSQWGKLIGTGAVADTVFGVGASQGSSVALSADGSTAIVGGPSDNYGAGAVWLFTRSGSSGNGFVWNQQGGKLAGFIATRLGSSVALSADGNTAIVGGPGDNTVSVFTRSGSVWTQQSGRLVGTGATGQGAQGCSVALSADGNTAILGGKNAWVFTRSGSVWTQQGNGFGLPSCSVALSADGNTAAAVGASSTLVYTRSGSVWSQQGSSLVGTGAVGSSGHVVALSGDGNTAIVGGPTDNGGAGAVWVFASLNPSLPSIASGGIVNGASFLPGVAPGTWVTIRGSNLSTTTGIWTESDFSGSNLPTQLDGVSVTVNGKAAYVYYISPTQLNVLSPADNTQGGVPVQVTTAQGKSNVVNAIEAQISPALFTFSQQGGKYAAAVRSDGAYIAPPNLISGQPAVPAKAGDLILLFGTGFGPTTPSSPVGQVINPAPLASAVTVRIGGSVANTQFAGIVSPGLYQFNVVVPNVPNGDNTVSIAVGGSSSQANVFLTVQQ